MTAPAKPPRLNWIVFRLQKRVPLIWHQQASVLNVKEKCDEQKQWALWRPTAVPGIAFPRCQGEWKMTTGVQQVENVIAKFSLPPWDRGREAGGRATCWRPPAGTQYLQYFLKIYFILRSSFDAPWTHFEFIPRPTWCIWTSKKNVCTDQWL